MKTQRTLCYEAQRELNDILGREQTPEEFEKAVNARMERHHARTEKRKTAKDSQNRKQHNKYKAFLLK